MSLKELPTEYVAGRFFVRPVTAEGILLRLFTDTGGPDFLRRSAVIRLGVNTESVTLGEKEVTVAAWPEFSPSGWIPMVSLADDPRSQDLKGRLLVYPDDESKRDSDGTLGQAWFGGRVWTFDYPGRLLILHLESSDSGSSKGTASLGFPMRSDGRRATHFPSIEATIDGETHSFLLDTGATVYLTSEAQEQLGGPPKHATCFVTAWLFERWREGHPDWRVIELGDSNIGGQPMIEVPIVRIAGIEVGPVWFTRRPDRNFHEYMSSMMDRKVEGALGGSLLQYFTVTVNYPRSMAHFKPA